MSFGGVMAERVVNVPRRPTHELEPVLRRLQHSGHASAELIGRVEGLG